MGSGLRLKGSKQVNNCSIRRPGGADGGDFRVKNLQLHLGKRWSNTISVSVGVVLGSGRKQLQQVVC